MIYKFILLILTLNINNVRGERGILDTIKKVARNVFINDDNIPIEVQNLSFTTAEDFKMHRVHEVTLNPGNALIVTCRGLLNGERAKIYPPNPNYETLYPLDDNFITYDKLNHTVPLRDLIRFLTPLIDVTRVKNGVLKFVYTRKNIVAAIDQNVTINVACSGLTSDEGTSEFGIQWIKITLGMTIPFSYGCGMNSDGLFLNLLDNQKRNSKYTHCKVEATPGMTVGFYCDKSSYMYPPSCLNKTTGDDFGIKKEVVSTPYDNDRISMIRITSLSDKNSYIKCRCLSNGLTSAEIVIVHEPNKEFVFPRRLNHSNAIVASRNITFIRPGDTINITAPKDGTSLASMGGKYITYLVPKETDMTTNTLALRSNVGIPELVKIDEILGTASSNGLIDPEAKGLTITRVDGSSEMENNIGINMNYPADSIVVLKDVAASISNVLDVVGEDNKIRSVSQAYVSIIATDPYTYGCSVKYVNDSGIFKTDKYVVMDEVDGVVGCKVDARRAGSVGFFCPKPAKYDPPNCFEQVYLMKDMRNLPESNKDDNKLVSERLLSGTKIHLIDASEYGQSFNGSYIRAAMFNHKKIDDLNDDTNDEKLGPNNAVGCKCVDEQGKILAQILIFVPTNKPNHVSWTHDGVSSHN